MQIFMRHHTIGLATLLLLGNSQIYAEKIAGKAMLDEILVTADRREENTLEVAGSLQVIDAKAIANRNYENTDELIRAIPNAHMSQQRVGLGESNFSIRGVGTTTVNVDQTIGFYVDDVPVASVAEFGTEYFDVAQVEVLRGPQGTLYGRNALGGILHIKTNDPQAEKKMKLRAIFGSDNERRLAATINSPLGSDTLIARVNVLNSANDTRIANIAIDGKDVDRFDIEAVRAKLLWLANEDLSVLLTFDLSESEQTTGAGSFETATDIGVNSLRPAILNKTSKGLGLKVEYDLDRFHFTSLSSLRKQDQGGHGSRPEAQRINPQLAFTTVLNNNFGGSLDQTTFTQEFRMESFGDGPIQGLLGVFFQRNKAARRSEIVNIPSAIFERSLATTQDNSLAIFADLNYALNEKLAITLGTRYTSDKKELSYRHQGSFEPLFGFNFAPNQALALDKNFSDISPRLVFGYQLQEHTHLYTKFSRGYKAGGYNTEFLSPVNAPYKKESIWNYEAGFKTRLFQNRLELEANIFYMDWADQQVLSFGPAGSSIENAKKSVSKGLEIQSRIRPTNNLQLSASLGYVSATFEDTPAGLPIAGNEQPNTPDLSAAASAHYQRSLNEELQYFIDVDISYQSSFYWDVNNQLEEPGHSFVNLSTGIKNDQYELSVFAKNLLGEKYRTNAFAASPGFFAAQGQPGHSREIGLKLELNI